MTWDVSETITTLKLDKVRRRWLEDAAEQSNCSMSTVMREAIDMLRARMLFEAHIRESIERNARMFSDPRLFEAVYRQVNMHPWTNVSPSLKFVRDAPLELENCITPKDDFVLERVWIFMRMREDYARKHAFTDLDGFVSAFVKCHEFYCVEHPASEL